MSFPSVLRVLLFSSVLLAVATLARADDPATGDSDVAALRSEVAALREELQALKAALGLSGLRPAMVRAAMPSSSSTRAPEAQPVAPPDPRVEILEQQVAELAQVKVESATRQPVKLFGQIHTHAFANVGEANWLDIPNLVPVGPAAGPSGTFSAALRQTRLGVALDGPTVGGLKVRGTAVMDFFGGIPNFQTGQAMGLPRLLVAFARLDGERTSLVAGQDHMVLAPRDPTSLAASSFPGLFRSGNLYLRAPQVTLERELGGGLRVAGGMMAPIGGDAPEDQYRFVPPALAGERSRHPAAQLRLQYRSGDVDALRRVDVGVSGHWGRERYGSRVSRSWAAALDLGLRRDWIGVAGEVFTGDNVDAFGGGTGLPARAAGGWGELQLYPTSRVRVNAGGGVDRLRGTLTALARQRGRSAFGNVIVSLTPELDASFEYWWLATRPVVGNERRNQHLDWVLVYRF
jgi:hypothetical protein